MMEAPFPQRNPCLQSNLPQNPEEDQGGLEANYSHTQKPEFCNSATSGLCTKHLQQGPDIAPLFWEKSTVTLVAVNWPQNTKQQFE